ncbi:MAG TPA: BMP family ABC transporter substrate-binding protein [Oceanospirillaceae bacterium]|nr:BMP family ABC transporter substrate-binding protein [Oceanospirillaceae bacterium]
MKNTLISKTIKGVSLAIATSALSLSAMAADINPAVVYSDAGKFDKSFSEAVWNNGVKRFMDETGIEVKEAEPTNLAQVEQYLKRLAKRGHSPIVAVGFSQTNAVLAAAQEYPDTQFTLIDGWAPEPNVQNVGFKEHEGSFLVGVLAAMKSESGVLGFVGGMDIPLISAFGCGYEQGAKYQNADIKVIQNMTGSTPAAFGNPSKGAELTRSQMESGADVIFAAAGGTGTGVYQAAADAGKYAIGVDSNQNHLHPGTMLTSMVKRVGEATYLSYTSAMENNWQAGPVTLGLAEGGVDWALDEHNRPLITSQMEARVNDIKAKIIAGDIVVHDYRTDNACTY